MPEVESQDLTRQLEDEHILVRSTPNPLACRVSTGFYNTEEEIDRLAAAIQQVRASA